MPRSKRKWALPVLIESQDEIPSFSAPSMSVERALQQLREARDNLSLYRLRGETLAWVGLWDKKQYKRHPWADSDEGRNHLPEIDRAYEETCAEADKLATKILAGMGNDEARAEAVRLINRASEEALSRQSEPLVTGPAVDSLSRLLKVARPLLLKARQIRATAWKVLRDGGDVLLEHTPIPLTQSKFDQLMYKQWRLDSNWDLIEDLIKGITALEWLSWRLSRMEVLKRKPGKRATPALNAAYLGLFSLFQEKGLPKNKARNYTGGLLYAAALTNTPDGSAVKAKLSTLKS